MADKKYEFEEALSDQKNVRNGIATGLLAALGLGVTAYKNSKAKDQKEAERKQLELERNKLEQELNEYNSRLLSFVYEDEKANIRRKISEIDNKLKKL